MVKRQSSSEQTSGAGTDLATSVGPPVDLAGGESTSSANPTPESLLSSGVGLSLHSSEDKKSSHSFQRTPSLSFIKLGPPQPPPLPPPALATFFGHPSNKVGSAAPPMGAGQLIDGVQSMHNYHQPMQTMQPTSRGSLPFPINANQANSATSGANLPTSTRKVRDSSSLLFMLIYLGFLAYIIWDGMQMKDTDLNLVVHGHDSYGNICGKNNKPLRFVEKSGKNYTDKPYTKYTLINSHFERYTMIPDQMRSGQLIYVKEQAHKQPRQLEPMVSSTSPSRRPPDTNLAKRLVLKSADKMTTTTTTTNSGRNKRAAPSTRPPFDLENMQKNRSYLNEMKSRLMYQYPPMHGYTSSMTPSTTTTTTTTTTMPTSATPNDLKARSALQELDKWQSMNKLTNNNNNKSTSSSKTINKLVSSIVRSNPNLVSFDDHVGSNESDRYEHMLITPTNTNYLLLNHNNNNNRDGRPSTEAGVLNHNEVTNQLLYLTECVSSCPQQDHVELVFYRCMPNNWRFSLFPNAINVTRTFIDDILTDISHCYRELIYTFSLALVLSLGLLILLRFLASLIIWSCILLLISLFLSLAIYSWITYYYLVLDLNELIPHDSTMIYADKLASSDRWLIGSIFLTFVSFATIGIVIFMRKRILLVTMLFRESGKAIADMPLLLLQPLLTFGALVGISVAWLAGWICLQSMKAPVVDMTTGFVVFKADTFYKIMRWYHIFAFLWVSHFAIACQHYVIGASVSKWYFSPNRYQLLNSPIAASTSELILYYLGSVALGSFLVAIFKVIRIITRQIQFLVQHNCLSSNGGGGGGQQVSGSGSGSGNGNGINSLTTSSSCCGSFGYIWRLFIWFFDNIVMIINRDAYVEIAIHGDSFIAAAQRAFNVLAKNPLRLIAIKSVSNILLLVAKICVVFGTISMAYVLLEDKGGQLNYSWSPIVISALYAYIVAHWFLSVYEMVIDALFICYCEDYELTKKSHESALSIQMLTGSRFMNQILANGQSFVA